MNNSINVSSNSIVIPEWSLSSVFQNHGLACKLSIGLTWISFSFHGAKQIITLRKNSFSPQTITVMAVKNRACARYLWACDELTKRTRLARARALFDRPHKILQRVVNNIMYQSTRASINKVNFWLVVFLLFSWFKLSFWFWDVL